MRVTAGLRPFECVGGGDSAGCAPEWRERTAGDLVKADFYAIEFGAKLRLVPFLGAPGVGAELGFGAHRCRAAVATAKVHMIESVAAKPVAIGSEAFPERGPGVTQRIVTVDGFFIGQKKRRLDLVFRQGIRNQLRLRHRAGIDRQIHLARAGRGGLRGASDECDAGRKEITCAAHGRNNRFRGAIAPPVHCRILASYPCRWISPFSPRVRCTKAFCRRASAPCSRGHRAP